MIDIIELINNTQVLKYKRITSVSKVKYIVNFIVSIKRKSQMEITKCDQLEFGLSTKFVFGHVQSMFQRSQKSSKNTPKDDIVFLKNPFVA